MTSLTIILILLYAVIFGVGYFLGAYRQTKDVEKEIESMYDVHKELEQLRQDLEEDDGK
jgi:preprotein translocase subunit YajC